MDIAPRVLHIYLVSSMTVNSMEYATDVNLPSGIIGICRADWHLLQD